MGEIRLVRIDSRLSHGKVVEVWTKELGLKTVLIANDRVSGDDFRKKVMNLTIPEGVKAYYLKVSEVKDFLKDTDEDVFILVEKPQDLKVFYEDGLDIGHINVGIIHMSEGKKSLTEEVAVDHDDLQILKDFLDRGSEVYIRLSPFAQKIDLATIFKKDN